MSQVSDIVSQVVMWPMQSFGMISALGISLQSVAPLAIGVGVAYLVKGNPIDVVQSGDLMSIGAMYLLIGAGFAAGNMAFSSAAAKK